MTSRSFILAALVSAATTGGAHAAGAVSLTPPLYREQARQTAQVRPASELTTTPRLVPPASSSRSAAAQLAGH